ncbi:kynureninase [Xanthomonadaceae bacterium XH05]|nr:kynureninase [Xanthomonadaceae bacterium XH05]
MSSSLHAVDAELDAVARDADDPLRSFREEFLIPPHGDGHLHYFCGNSLGLQPRAAREVIELELDRWARLAVEGHFRGDTAWMTYHEGLRDGIAMLVGAKPIEVVAMNTLSVNLHLLMVSFYRPTHARPAILIEAGAFPSDRHAVESQIRFHGFDPAQCLIELAPDEPGGTLSMQTIADVIEREGNRIALVLWPGVQYRTGQAFDLAEITRLAHARGAMVGFDLAHAVGNLPLALHDADADFAAWCHYKYVNAGPGAVAGAFVHARHAHADLPRFAGWWGHEKTSRFAMGPQFVPAPGAEGWQLSNPPILAMAALRPALGIFQHAGMSRLREKSLRLTGYLESLIHEHLADVLHIVTPAETVRRGCQLSLRVREGRDAGRSLFEFLSENGVLGDWREPDVIRISPAPLYNTHLDVLRFAQLTAVWRDSTR